MFLVKYLKEKKVLCSHYHFNFDSFDKEDFIELDSFSSIFSYRYGNRLDIDVFGNDDA